MDLNDKLLENARQKSLLKALETPEEKRARRLAKKLEKDKKKKEKLGWDDEHLSYTNVDNPFGDSNLHRPFIWRKKFQKEGIDNVPESKLLEINSRKLEENKLELEKVKKRRWLYEKEKESRDYEVELIQREKEAAQFKEWEKQEDKFHLEQALLRSEIRISDNRAKPIDLLAKYISNTSEDLNLEMHEPYTYLNGLNLSDLEDLLEDIKVYIELEQGQNVDYWKDITVIVEDELDKLKQIVAAEKDEYYSHRREGINKCVRDDVLKIFKGKTYTQLELLANQITEKIQTQENIDIGYWESLLKQLKAYMAKARLREKHQDLLRQKLYQFKKEQGVLTTQENNLFPIPLEELAQSKMEGDVINDENSQIHLDTSSNILVETETLGERIGDEKEQNEESEENEIEASYLAYEEGRYSPELIPEKYIEKGVVISQQDEEIKRIEYSRKCYQHTGSSKYSIEDLMIKQVCEGIALADEEECEDEEASETRYKTSDFSTQIPLPPKDYLWRDKYKPRKPRFFNRVHTGFEWNKYNQTHYDFDNPPPKIVQGYKFNIFYPDLIDKGVTPKYSVNPCYEEGQDKRSAPTPDFAVLRFSAGPPYEDIAFKIVNREWECSYKRGIDDNREINPRCLAEL